MADNIGSVSVRVTPDARDFAEKLRAELGNIPDVKVKLDDADARARIAELRASLDRLGHDRTVNVRVREQGSKEATKSVSTLVVAAAALGPALIPLGAVAAASFGAVAEAGGIGLLAFQGIKAEMKAGTTLGQTYTAGVAKIKTGLSGLEQTAAKGVLSGFQSSVKTMTSAMPHLNAEVAKLSPTLGDIASHGVHALIGGLSAFQPVFTTILTALDGVARKADGFVSGGGLNKFVLWIQGNLPQVGATIQALATLVTHFAGALGSQGMVATRALQFVSNVINALPIGVLTTLTSVAAAGLIVFKGYTTLAPVIAFFKGLAAAELVAAGASKADAAAQATLGKGIGAAASKYGSLIGAFAAGAAILTVNNVASSAYLDHLGLTVKTGGAAAAAVEALTASSSISTTSLRGFGVQTSDLNKVLKDTFGGESSATKFASFKFGLDGIIKTPFNSATDDAKKFFKSTDNGLTQIAQSGDTKGAAAAFDTIAAAAKKQGISIDQLKAKFPQYEAFLDSTAGKQAAFETTLTSTAAKYGLTSAQAGAYASVVGSSEASVVAGTETLAQYNAALKNVSNAYNTASASGRGYLDALTAFGASAGTAADRGTLIAATLVAGNGDALGYAGSMASAAAANQQFVSGFTKAERSTVNLKTGMIDFKNAAAQPLIASLQGLQTAAAAAASATFQHEVATKGGAQASKDAAAVFKNDTHGALIAEAKQLGLTKGQATALADQYFHMPASVTTKVISEGTQTVIDVLNEVGQQLAILSKHPWTTILHADDQATPTVADVTAAIKNIPAGNVTVKAQNDASSVFALIQRQVNGLTGKTIKVTTVYDTKGNVPSRTAPRTSAFGGTFAYGGAAYAGGGGVWPGYAPGVDSIPVKTPRGPGLVSAGEGIVVPEALRGIGGPRALYNLNRHFAPRVTGHTANYGLAAGGAFAAGGSPGGFTHVTGPKPSSGKKGKAADKQGKAADTQKQAAGTQSKAAKTNKETAEKLATARKAQGAKLTTLIDKTVASLKAIGDKLRGYRAAGQDAGNQYFTDQGLGNLVKPDRSAFGQTTDAIRNIAFEQGTSKPKTDARIAWLQGENKTLTGLVKTRNADIAALATAKDRLKTLTDQRSAETATITGATQQSFNIAGAQYADTYSIKAQLQAKVAQAVAFGKDLKTALTRGGKDAHGNYLLQSMVTQLAEAGADAGAVSARTLAHASVSDLKTIESLQSKLNSTSAGIGRTISGDANDAGVANQQKTYDKLKLTTVPADTKALKTLGQKMAGQIQKWLTIKVPSINPPSIQKLRALAKQLNAGHGLTKSMKDAGVHAANGLAAGLKSRDKHLTGTIDGLSADMIKALRKALGIHSPSAVMAAQGSFAGEGFNLGLQRHIDPVSATAKRLATAAIPGVNGSLANGVQQKPRTVRLTGTVKIVDGYLDMSDTVLEYVGNAIDAGSRL